MFRMYCATSRNRCHVHRTIVTSPHRTSNIQSFLIEKLGTSMSSFTPGTMTMLVLRKIDISGRPGPFFSPASWQIRVLISRWNFGTDVVWTLANIAVVWFFDWMTPLSGHVHLCISCMEIQSARIAQKLGTNVAAACLTPLSQCPSEGLISHRDDPNKIEIF